MNKEKFHVLIRKDHVTLMKVEHVDEEIAYACSICGWMYFSKLPAENCCKEQKEKQE